MTSVSAGHIILTPTQPVGSGRPQRESNPGPPHQESRALPTELPRSPYRLREREGERERKKRERERERRERERERERERGVCGYIWKPATERVGKREEELNKERERERSLEGERETERECGM